MTKLPIVNSPTIDRIAKGSLEIDIGPADPDLEQLPFVNEYLEVVSAPLAENL